MCSICWVLPAQPILWLVPVKMSAHIWLMFPQNRGPRLLRGLDLLLYWEVEFFLDWWLNGLALGMLELAFSPAGFLGFDSLVSSLPIKAASDEIYYRSSYTVVTSVAIFFSGTTLPWLF